VHKSTGNALLPSNLRLKIEYIRHFVTQLLKMLVQLWHHNKTASIYLTINLLKKF